MDILELASRSHGAELHVFIGLAVAHLQGADTVAPSWLVTHVNQSRNTIAGALRRLEAWGLAEMITTQKWRLSAAGRGISLPENAQQLCVSDEVRAGELSTGKPELSTGYQVDAVSLRLETHNLCAFPEERTQVVRSGPCSSSGLERSKSIEIQPLQPQAKTHNSCAIPDWVRETAEGLADVIRDRVHCRRDPLVSALSARLQAGANPDQLELDLLLYAAYVRLGDGRPMNNKGGYVVSLIKAGERASRALVEVLESAVAPEASGPYSGYTDAEIHRHPDLVRVRELIARIDGNQETQE